MRVNTDKDGSTKITDCGTLKVLTGDGCFVRFSDLPPGYKNGNEYFSSCATGYRLAETLSAAVIS